MKRIKVVALLLALSLMVVGCANKQTPNSEAKDSKKTESKQDGKIKAYTSVYPVYDFAKKIGGDKVDVELIVPNGQAPHGWEPGQKEIQNLEKANVFIYNGAGLESWTDKVVDTIQNKELVIVDSSEGIELLASTHEHEHEDEDHDHGHEKAEEHKDHEDDKDHEAHEEHGHEHGAYDPHIWLSPKNATKQLENITKAFVKVDPNNEKYYSENLAKYTEEFKKLDEEYKSKLANTKNKSIVVSHEAYSYLLNEYGIKQIGIEGVNAETEPDAKTMSEIVKVVKENNIKTIFTEDLIETKVADAIAKETGAKTVVLNPLESLSQEEVKNNDDYLSVMKNNLEKLVGALNE